MQRRYRNIENYSSSQQRRILRSLRAVDSSDSDETSVSVSNSTSIEDINSTIDDNSSVGRQSDFFSHDSGAENDDSIERNSYDSDFTFNNPVADLDSDNVSISSTILSYNSLDRSDTESNATEDDDYSDALDSLSGDSIDDLENESDDLENENDDFENENDDLPIDDDPPLFPGCPLTFSESLLSILSLTLRHTITGVLLASILQLVHLHCPEPNYCVKSVYMFKKYFEELRSPINKHYYCTNCCKNLENQNDQCPNCGNLTKTNYFLTISIISQLQALYNRRGFQEKLNYPRNRVKLSQENIEDIYDGKIYQELSADGEILSDPNNISFSWYTDGVQVFKSSKFSFWPIYLVINELPYADRFKKENLILAAMWFDEQKPLANSFLLPLYNEVSQLKNGVDFSIADQNDPVNVKAIIICGTCDLPAKALFLNMNQYNGKFGCHKCQQEGERIGKVQVYPYMRNLPLRTENETLRQANSVNRHPVNGVKGLTMLFFLVFKWIQTTSIDAMHCVFEGVMRALLKLWFDPKYADMRFSLYEHLDEIDERLKNITPPGFVQRRPRSIKKHLKHWKASELKNFFFYFCLIVLHDKMTAEYFQHLQLLVGAIVLLCQQSISQQMIEDARRMIHEFVSRYENLYGLRHMTCNLHSLLHLPDLVILLGPLWVYSCFTYENINGKLKQLVHGSKSAELQIYNGVSLYLNTFTLNKDFLNEGTKVYEYCKKQLCTTKQLKLSDIGNSLFIVGCLSKLRVPDNIMLIFQAKQIIGINYFVFKRLLKNPFVYMSEIYTRATVTNSTCAKYIANELVQFGIIHMFVRVTNCLCRKLCQCLADHFVVLKKCTHTNAFNNICLPGIRIKFVKKIEIVNDEFEIVNVSSLKSLCFLINLKGTNLQFAIETVNTLEEE